MKIYIIYPGGDVTKGGGVERRFARIVEYLSKNSPENEITFLVTRSFAKWLRDNFSFCDDNQIIAPISEKNRLSYCFWCIKMIFDNKPDVVHFLNVQRRILPIVFFSKLFRRRIITSIISSKHASPKTKVWEIPYYAWIEWLLSDKLDSLYPSILQTLLGKLFSKKIEISPCSFTDYDKYSFNISTDTKKPHILFCGRMIEEKNPLWLLKAVLELKEILAVKGWHIFLIGGGPLEQEVQSFIFSNQLENIVTIKVTNNTAPLFKEASIFLSLQKIENYPSQSLLEAMGCSCCIIATDVGNTRLLVDNSTGFLVNENIPNSLKETLDYCINNPQVVEEKGMNAQKKVKEEHRIENYCNYIINLWKSTYYKQN